VCANRGRLVLNTLRVLWSNPRGPRVKLLAVFCRRQDIGHARQLLFPVDITTALGRVYSLEMLVAVSFSL